MRRLFGLIGTITSVLQNREIGSDTDSASVLVPGKSTNHPAMRLLMTSPTAAQWRVTAFKSQGLKQPRVRPRRIIARRNIGDVTDRNSRVHL